METFTIQDLAYSIVLVLGGLGGLFHVIQRSKCVKINCWGVNCDRVVTNEEETDSELGGSVAIVQSS